MKHQYTTAKEIQSAIDILWDFHKTLVKTHADSRTIATSASNLDDIADDLKRFGVDHARPWRDDVTRPNRFAALFMPDGRILVRTVQDSDVTDIQKLYMSSPEAAEAYLILENIPGQAGGLDYPPHDEIEEGQQPHVKVLKHRYDGSGFIKASDGVVDRGTGFSHGPIEGVINGG